MRKSPLILLTGATGYIGGRLLKLLEADRLAVRCVSRRKAFLLARVSPGTEVVEGDVLDADAVRQILEGVDTAYYLVHSMGRARGFEETDRRAAELFGKAASEQGVRRIIYLGGLGDPSDSLSPHLRSRQEVGSILRQSGVQVIEFRASIVIGSGSLSFEMIRALVERLPILLTPRWVAVKSQPIAIGDVLQYLRAGLDVHACGNPIYEIGGPDRVSYGDLMKEYARQRGLHRWMIPVPVLTPRLSSLWLGLVTPLYARIGRKLIDSIRHPTIVRNAGALETFKVLPIGAGEAIATALRNEDREYAETRWSDALSSSGEAPRWGGMRFGNRLIDSRTISVQVPPAKAFAPIRRIGGENGYYFGNWLWKVRGWIDLLFGGVGMRRGRKHLEYLSIGDTIDCWRVEKIEEDRKLVLLAEMKLPGRAWLEFEVTGKPNGSQIRQTAIFDPAGLWGLFYWYLMYPMHQFIFSGMRRGIARAACAVAPGKTITTTVE
jgi:uncharacterized protein YbjT (DUF2867 family)